MRQSFIATTVALLAIVALAAGCNDADDPGNGNGTTAENHDGHGHDHGHEHPPHGPNGGHIFKLDSDGHSGEWCKFKDNDIIKMHLLDAEGKKAVPMKVDSFVVKPLAGNDDVSFEFAAENADDEGMASTFMLDDEDLSMAISLGVSIEIKSGDTVMKGKIDAHEPLDH
ncbi:MAG: hypothetical protein AAFN77_18585 [Planctomycetota bacterium]